MISRANSREELAARRRLVELLSGYIATQIIYCATELELADKLAGGPKTVAELAESSGCSEEHLGRLLRTLCAVGVFKLTDGQVHLTALSEWLRRDRADSLWSAASFMGNEMYRALLELTFAVRTGNPGWNRAMPLPIWSYVEQNPERGRVFDEMICGLCASETGSIVDAYDFSLGGSGSVVVDVGGGNGSVLLEILRRHERVRGVLLEMPGVIDRARVRLRHESQSVRARCLLEAGDFLVGVPSGGDIYLLRHVLHDWSDAPAVRILHACRAAGGSKGRLLIVEELIGTGASAEWMDIGMMNNFGGKERTLEEYRELLEKGGYRLARSIPVSTGVTLLEAEPG